LGELDHPPISVFQIRSSGSHCFAERVLGKPTRHIRTVRPSTGYGWKASTGYTRVVGKPIRVGAKVVRLAAQIENDEHADTKFLIGLRVDVFVDDVLQHLTYGSVGIGNDREEAISTAASEWAMAVGDALLGALGVKVGKDQSKSVRFRFTEGQHGSGAPIPV